MPLNWKEKQTTRYISKKKSEKYIVQNNCFCIIKDKTNYTNVDSFLFNIFGKQQKLKIQ